MLFLVWKYVSHIMFQRTLLSEGATARVAPSLLHFKSIRAKFDGNVAKNRLRRSVHSVFYLDC